MRYIYWDGGTCVFQDPENFEQLEIPRAVLGEAIGYVVPEVVVTLRLRGTEVVGVELPPSVKLVVTEVAPVPPDDQDRHSMRPVTLETGKVINAPRFINPGDQIMIDTRNGEYITRI